MSFSSVRTCTGMRFDTSKSVPVSGVSATDSCVPASSVRSTSGFLASISSTAAAASRPGICRRLSACFRAGVTARRCDWVSKTEADSDAIMVVWLHAEVFAEVDAPHAFVDDDLLG